MIRFLSILGLISLQTMMAPTASSQDIRVMSETADRLLIADVKRATKPDTPAETEFAARRQARSAAEHARSFLNSKAYFDPEISFAVDAGPPILPVLRVEPGQQFRFSKVRWDTSELALPSSVSARLNEIDIASAGEMALPDRVVSHETALVAELRSMGYPEARAVKHRAIGDRDTGTVEIVFQLEPGPRVRFGNVRYETDLPVRRPYLDRLIPFQPGDRFNPAALSDYNRRLRDTRNFSTASARLAEPETEATPNADENRDILVSASMRKRYSLGAGASYSTAEGAGLTAELTRHNATRRGDTLTGEVILAQLNRSAGLDWQIPNVFAYDHTISFTATIDEEETDAFDREALTLNGIYTLSPIQDLSLGFGLQVELASEIDAFEQRDIQVLSAGGGFRYDRSDDPLDPSTGWRVESRIEPTAVQGDDTANFVKLNTQLTAYQPLSSEGRFVAAGRLRAGFIYGARLDDVPVSRRFFAGGGGSARGFEFQSVGPTDDDGQPTGGRRLLEASAELRMRSDTGFGGVVFVDAASVSAGRSIDASDVSMSAGVGVRYGTPIGPVRFDIATPIDRDSGDDPIQIYVSIGQAF
ncbi:MAG: BamA/TamA family outer membrane protein [Pseudomonadota bacterium]